MSVDTFDPNAQLQGSLQNVSQADLAVLLGAAEGDEAESFGLSSHEVARLAKIVRQDGADWQQTATSLASEQALALVRFLVVAERRLPGWESGAKSPVISLVKVLKAQNAYPEELTAWIKAHSENRFLPYGSLLDRL